MSHRHTFLGYAVLLWGLSVVFLAGPDIYANSVPQVSKLIGGVVGVSADVPPNAFNSLAQQLEEKQKELAQRSDELSAREQAIAAELDGLQRDREQRIYAYLFALTAILLFLVIVNFYLDHRRRSPQPS